MGGVDADSIKHGIDSIFSETDGSIKMTPEEYRVKVVSATADGASVNTGKYSGVLTQLASDRKWLVPIHCSNHRMELAFKSASSNSTLQTCDETYIAIYFLHKNSGKLSHAVQEACKTLMITGHRKLPKIHGTRFINHRRRGIKAMLDMWPGFITAYENALADPGHRNETKAKISGFLKKFKSYEFLCKMASYLDILDASGPASLVFEGDGLMVYEVEATIERTCFELEELAENAGTDEELLSSYINMFKVSNDSEITGCFVKDGHGRKKLANRESLEIVIEGMTFTQSGRNNAAAGKKKLALELKDLLLKRFNENVTEIYTSMKFYDPQYWTDDSEYGVENIRSLMTYFKVSLAAANFDDRKVFSEWRSFKIFAKRNYSEFFEKPKCLWQRILKYRHGEFPNLCCLIELLTCFSGSNSEVERAFSTLTLLLSDRRLSMDHQTMDDLMVVKCNNYVWTEQERREILDLAVARYMEKRRKTRVDNESIAKRPCPATVVEIEESSSSGSSEDEDDDIFDDYDL